MSSGSSSPAAFSTDAFNKGDQRAFELLFWQFYQALCYFAEKIVADRFTAEEIAEDTLMKLWERHDKFNNLKAIKYFLYITTRNACLNHLESEHRKAKRQHELASLADVTESTVLHTLIEAEVLREIDLAVGRLPERYRRIIKLAFGEGLKSKEIAARLEMPLSTVDNQKARALALLKKSLTGSSFTALLVLMHSNIRL